MVAGAIVVTPKVFRAEGVESTQTLSFVFALPIRLN
jgi:hypothetical protein